MDFLRDKLHLTEREYGFTVRTTSFVVAETDADYVRTIEQTLHDTLNCSYLVTPQARILINGILYKCASYRFDQEVIEELGR